MVAGFSLVFLVYGSDQSILPRISFPKLQDGEWATSPWKCGKGPR